MRFQFSRVVVVGLASLSLAACGGGGGGGGGGDGPSPPASVTIVAGNGQTGEVGTLLPAALTVRVTDSAGRPQASVAVGWAVTPGSGAVNPPSSITDSAGSASTRWTLGTTAGSQQATATVAGLAPVSYSATAVAGNATASVTVTGPTTTPYEGDTVQLTAIPRDQYGNVIPGKTFTWTSSEPEWAPVSATGLLNTWGTGPVTVVASVDGARGAADLMVNPILATVSVGPREVVLDWTTDRCEDLDVPDGPARVVRAGDSTLVLFSGNAPRYYASRGADFSSLRRDCSAPVLASADDRTPQSYENWEWIWSLYREGSTWHALVHNEFHDTFGALCRQGDPSPANPCWYNSITHAVSTDGGRTFSKPLAPAHVVAPAPNVWTPPTPETPVTGYYYFEGYRAPSNIVSGPDGYFYSLMDLAPVKSVNDFRICVMRTRTLADASSWRAWDGTGFNLRMASPYVTGSFVTGCTALHWPIGDSSLTYNTYLDRFMLVNDSGTNIDGQQTCGIFYQLSRDLIHWSIPQPLVEARIFWCDTDPQQPGVLESVYVMYPSLVDHGDATVNFERTGRTPHLYYTRFNDGGLDRDLVRVPLTLTRMN